jgi:ADP-ribose pyrophosphatase YjhB (NUDIX family)
MNFTQRIYFNDKLLILTTDKREYINNNPHAGSFSIFQGTSSATVLQAVELLEKKDIQGVIIEDKSPDKLWGPVREIYHPLDAAGGVAYNEAGEILMIYRRGKWDLPKGKLDEGELIEDCALREVSEETGLEKLSLGEKICDTYHIYEQNREHLLKRTAWYKMAGSSEDKLNPQKEENIMEARWVREKDLGPFAARTYEAVREVLKIAGLQW